MMIFIYILLGGVIGFFVGRGTMRSKSVNDVRHGEYEAVLEKVMGMSGQFLVELNNGRRRFCLSVGQIYRRLA